MTNANVNSEPKRALLKWFFLGLLFCLLPWAGSTYLSILFDPTSRFPLLSLFGYIFAFFGIPLGIAGILLLAHLNHKYAKNADTQANCILILAGIACGLALSYTFGPALREYRLQKLVEISNVEAIADVVEAQVLTLGYPPKSPEMLGPTYLSVLQEEDLGRYELNYFTSESVPRRFESELTDGWVIVLADHISFDSCFYVYDSGTQGWEFSSCE